MTPEPTRRSVLAAAGAGVFSLAGCLGNSEERTQDDDRSDSGGNTPTESRGTSSPTEETDPAVDATTLDGLPTAERALPISYPFQTLRDRTQSGGPPKDGIPSVDEPVFWDVSRGDDFLSDADVVFGIARGETVKAYPQRILVWHEITNDVVDGSPASVTYCPLTGTAMGFERGETTFGVSGKLVNSNLVMYDRATDSRWPQVLATAVSGAFEGSSLVEFPVTWTTWGRWKAAHPDTVVLSTDTGFARNYGRDPYGDYTPPGGYYTSNSTLFRPLTEDDRFAPKTVVIGSRTADGPLAFVKDTLRERGVLTGTTNNVGYVAAYEETLDTAHVYRNPDGLVVETATEGVVVDGDSYAPGALPLDPVVDFDAMWFAWAGFYPQTAVVG